MNKGTKERRKHPRYVVSIEATVGGSSDIGHVTYPASLVDFDHISGKLELKESPRPGFTPSHALIPDLKIDMPLQKVISRNEGRTIIFLTSEPIPQFSTDGITTLVDPKSSDRRQNVRRQPNRDVDPRSEAPLGRRLADYVNAEFPDLDDSLQAKAKVLFRQKSSAYDRASVDERRTWLEQHAGVQLESITHFAQATEHFKGNIENLVGVAQLPIGVAGPLRLNGHYAKGDFYVPLATTEGVLVNSYTLGMSLITRAGGATVRLLADEMRISPLFGFANVREAIIFQKWLKANFRRIKAAAESTTKHGKLLRIEPKVLNRQVVVLFVYDTGDAMGLNMICKATDYACQFICEETRPRQYYLRSNFSSNKKASAYNFQHTYGKSLIAEVTIPRDALALLQTTPEEMEAYSKSVMLTGTHAGIVGNNGHYANGLAAMFIALGQDVAHVASSSVGVSTCEATPEGSLYIAAQIPNLLVASVGGGTGLATSRACLELLGCYGSGKSKKLAEIVAGTLLAGEIAIAATVVNRRYVSAHEKYGRNRPK